MLRGIAFFSVLLAFWMAAQIRTNSEESLIASSDAEPCNAPAVSQDPAPPAMDVSIAEISFWGTALEMPLSDQHEIAATVKSLAHGDSENNVLDEALEQVREGWQNHGYFQARVSGDSKILSSNAVSQRLSLSVHVEEGFQYRLQEITFKHNRIFYSKVLRSLFPIEEGEVVERQRISEGLENLKRAYQNQGFINYTPIPTPSFDEASRLMSWEIDIDEDKQFYVRHIKVLGLADAVRQEFLDKFLLRRGDVFNEHLLQLSLERQKLPQCSCDRVQRHLDEKNGIVDIALDFRPCN